MIEKNSEYTSNLIPDNLVGIVGAGGWGTALAKVLANNGFEVVLWAKEPELVTEINTSHSNSLYLEGISLPKNIRCVDDLNFFKETPFLVSAVPTQHIRATFSQNNILSGSKKVLNVAKGIEIGTLNTCSHIFSDLGIASDNFAVLTGPSHAEEVAKSNPTAVVASSANDEFAMLVQKIFSNSYFRVYTSEDTLGCELGGSLKNIIALAAGIVDGLKMGDNSKSALITRGLAEITRLAATMGANPITFMGLSGLGDLIVTCSSMHSRNRRVGQMIGEGMTLTQILDSMQMVAEGITTTKSAYELALSKGVEMPIIEKVYEVLFDNLNPTDAINLLMNRSSKNEIW